MEVGTYVKLTHDEIVDKIPYSLICQTRYGARWDTGKRRRAWVQQFSESERRLACTLFRQAHLWYLVRGVPDEVVMKASTLALWMKLGAFCGSL